MTEHTITIDTPGPEVITDNVGKIVWEATDHTEPEPGSVVLTGGDWGTAWQRQFSDGMWHSTRRKGGPKDWAWMLTRRNLVLAYDAEPRPVDYYQHMTGADAAIALLEPGCRACMTGGEPCHNHRE